ncbi:transporter substrate-binding domain-containing protein [Pseudodesulfovibrio sp.]|uniref:transporter substrate-binding domain-containing protein n=1 Tax=Pseudodesulfovibrio sp. TaxID=2035812 RepID=UPI002606EF6E|nr:transporter substrate-binding domain-containing protein [Pseudodesulfovibrio sp.]MDD3313354.1 transporter substrate-binding domain-containing protein [Pseudodesulfovibrio sp.]
MRFVLVVCLVSIRAEAGLAAAPEWDGARPLVVVHSRNMPPLSFLGAYGEPKGLIVDYWELWSRVNGVPIKMVLTDWVETLRMVRDGEADIHGGMFYTRERAREFDFEGPFVDMDSAVAVRKGLPVRSMADLKDVTLGVLAGGYAVQYLRDVYPDIRQKPYKGTAQVVQAALRGEIDALLTERVTLVHLLGEAGKLDEFRMLDVAYRHGIRPVVAKGNRRMFELVKKGMEVIPGRALERTYSRWTIPTPSVPSWLIALASLALLILVGGVFFFLFQFRRR